MIIRFKKLSKTALMPTQGTMGAAGFDLYADTTSPTIIAPDATVHFSTGIAVEIPRGYMGLLVSRSGIASRRGLRLSTCASVIDSDYRGDVGIPIRNDSGTTQRIDAHERIAQIVFVPVASVELMEAVDLTETARGDGGFGSTGR